jgi:hypothetical protein
VKELNGKRKTRMNEREMNRYRKGTQMLIALVASNKQASQERVTGMAIPCLLLAVLSLPLDFSAAVPYW